MAHGVCAFCQQEATLTGEHLWSEWIERLLKTSRYRFRRRDLIVGPTEWNAPHLNIKAKVVCAQCNNGWMSDLENETRLLLAAMIQTQDQFCATSLGIASLAAFAFKTAVIADHMSIPKRKPFFLPSIRERFSKNRIVPADVYIWIGMLKSNHLSGLCRASYHKARKGPLRGFELYALTWGVGQCVLQVASFSGSAQESGKVADWRGFERLGAWKMVFDVGLPRIWH